MNESLASFNSLNDSVEKIIDNTKIIRNSSAAVELDKVISSIKVFCKECHCRNGNSCLGYDINKNPSCELLWIFEKYKFEFK